MTAVAVLGGGISGLVAAYRLRELLGETARITLVEQSGRLGGKLRTIELAGTPFDVGAEAFLNRRPEAVSLVGELGLADALVHPGSARSTVLAGGRIRPVPPRTVMGVPAGPDALDGVLSPEAVRTVAAEATRPPIRLDGVDVVLGTLLRERLGDELTDRLVDPLLGGVYAGGVDGLGLRATMPALAGALDGGSTLTAAVRAALPSAEYVDPSPVFATLRGGLSGLVDALAARANVDIRLGVPARAVARTATGWRVELGAAAPAHAPADPVLDVDALVLALPAPAARRLLDGVVPAASAAFGQVEVASMAVVALALPAGAGLPGSSGVLLARGERHADGTPFASKAFTYSAHKWPHLSGEYLVLRGSVGRFGESALLQADDDEVVRLVLADLHELTGSTVRPVDAVVTRWGGGLPQYAVGHLDVVDRIERAIAGQPGLAVAGATLHGVGVPACIATGTAAAQRLASYLLSS